MNHPQHADVPRSICQYEVLEYGVFSKSIPAVSDTFDGGDSVDLKRIHIVAICRASPAAGFYTLFCTRDWEYVTGEFSETLELAKSHPVREFGQDVVEWIPRV